MGKKKGIFLALMLTAAVCSTIILIMVILDINSYENENMISRAYVSKMTAALFMDMSADDTSDNNEWYDTYVKENIDRGYMKEGSYDKGFTYGDLKYMLDAMNISLDDIDGTQDIVRRNRSRITPGQWYIVYNYLITYFDAPVVCVDLTIMATPAISGTLEEWQALTDNGVYGFRGLALDSSVDSTIRVLIRDNEILNILEKVSDEVTYRNVWVNSAVNGRVSIYTDGITREFFTDGLSENLENVMADITITHQQLTKVSVKKDTIRGKVLAVNENSIEIDGYGVVPYDADYRVYRLYGGFSEGSYTDILVGYDLQEIVVADGCVCGIIISYPLQVDTIRVIIKNTDYSSIYHGNVKVSSESGFKIINVSDEVVLYEAAANEEVELTRESDILSKGRVRLEAQDGGYLTLSSVKRSYGNPQYPGTLEVAFDENGLYIINDVSMEDYIKRVVPSEMPVSYGIEALKVQSVCARSYAYIQLLKNAYREYGAHIDDSTSYQVYNNVKPDEVSDEAVDATCGKVIKYNGNVIEAFYYSTSCGYGTDTGIWGGNAADYPYIKSRPVGTADKQDLTSNDDFYRFIANRNLNDYDVSFPYYRWRATLTIEDVNEYYGQKAKVGTIKSMSVDKRYAGGIVTVLTVHGSDGDYTVEGEYEIRKFLGNYNIYWRDDRESLFQMNYLPSAYFALRQMTYHGEVTGYEIIGGGYGHGVGVSQNAAYKMTQCGMTYEDIIHFFYDGVSIDTLY